MTRTHDKTAEELISLTGVSPREALAAARSLLAAGPGPRDASIAHQAAAIVLRDFGDVSAAIREFRLAARLARRGGSLHIAGRYEQARADLRQAIALTRRTGEVVWEARARTAAALTDLATGATARAEAGFTAAEALFA